MFGKINKKNTSGYYLNLQDKYVKCLKTLPIYNKVVSKPAVSVLTHVPDHDRLENHLAQDVLDAVIYVLKYGDVRVCLVRDETSGIYRLVLKRTTESTQEDEIFIDFKNMSILDDISGADYNNSDELQAVTHLYSYDKLISSLYLQSSTYSQPIIKVNDMSNISTEEGLQKALVKMEGINSKRDVNETMIMGTNDSFEYVSPVFLGFDSILKALQLDICMMFDIPFTKLFGESATGFNATGEGDRIDWTQTLKHKYTKYFLPLYNMIKENIIDYSKLDFYFIDYDRQLDKINSIQTITEALSLAMDNGFLSKEEAKKIFKSQVKINTAL